MKKLFLYSILIIVAMTIPACGKKEQNLYLGEKEIETEMPSERAPKETVVTKPEIVVSRSSSETLSKSETEPASPSKVTTEIIPQTSPSATPEEAPVPENTSGITFNDDGSVTVSQEILSKLAEEEEELVTALGLTDEQIEILISGGDLTLSPELQDKLLKFLDTLSFTEKLRLLGKLADLLENETS